MINFFTATHSVDSIMKTVRGMPPEKWPDIAEMVEIMKRATKEQQRVVFKKVFEVFSSRNHRKLSGDEQVAIWEAWENYGTDQFSSMVKAQYVLQRLNNEVMWVPENLREKTLGKNMGKFQAVSRDFFEKKSQEWKKIPTEELEAWIGQSEREFREKLNNL